FERDFAVEKVIKLEQNYRSHGNILDAANALIRHNRTRLGKNLWTAEGEGEPLRLFEASTDSDEAAYILDEVRSLQNEGVHLSEMALLYRSNAQSRVLEHALFNGAIAYRVYGGLRFFERQEIKHALGYLRLVANPDDDGAFLRIANFPTRGIGNRTLEQLQAAAQAGGTSLWHAACTNPPSGKAGSSIAAFVRSIEGMREACRGLPLPEIVEHVSQASGLIDHYRTEREGANRVENLEELVNAAAAFVAEDSFAAVITEVAPDETTAQSSSPTSAPGSVDSEAASASLPPAQTGELSDALTAFLTHAALEAGEHQAAAGADALQLMTVHSAKGLEFHTVFISGLEEGLFPHENSMNEEGGLEEERRLMYVAITRARRRLYLTHAQTRMLHGQTRYNIASRFLDEVPPQLVKRVNTAPALGVPSFKSPPPSFRAANGVIVGGFRIGQSVTHPKFGAGVIVQAEGRGADARVQVNFRDEGLKWLALEFAKLSPA
ncbi:MAG: 3'-5' exonuclease, partial [Burkholderiales bacterium]